MRQTESLTGDLWGWLFCRHKISVYCFVLFYSFIVVYVYHFLSPLKATPENSQSTLAKAKVLGAPRPKTAERMARCSSGRSCGTRTPWKSERKRRMQFMRNSKTKCGKNVT